MATSVFSLFRPMEIFVAFLDALVEISFGHRVFDELLDGALSAGAHRTSHRSPSRRGKLGIIGELQFGAQLGDALATFASSMMSMHLVDVSPLQRVEHDDDVIDAVEEPGAKAFFSAFSTMPRLFLSRDSERAAVPKPRLCRSPQVGRARRCCSPR